MTCKELSALIPDLVDGNLSPELQAECEAVLTQCPECRQELEIARQIRAFLVQFQADNPRIQLSSGFEARLMARIQQQRGNLEFLDLSSRAFATWLIELVNLIGGLLDPTATRRATKSATSQGI